jgi:hypothetical protein
VAGVPSGLRTGLAGLSPPVLGVTAPLGVAGIPIVMGKEPADDLIVWQLFFRDVVSGIGWFGSELGGTSLHGILPAVAGATQRDGGSDEASLEFGDGTQTS